MAEAVIAGIKEEISKGKEVFLGQPELDLVQREAVIRQAKRFGNLVRVDRVNLTHLEDEAWRLLVKAQAGMIGFEIEVNINNSCDREKGGLLVDPKQIIVRGGGMAKRLIQRISCQLGQDPVGELEKVFVLEKDSLGLRFTDKGLKIWEI